MSKHEEVIKALVNIRSNTTTKTTSHSIGNFLDTDLIEFDRDNLKKDYQIIETYITEQQKKDELLELYRELIRLDKSIRITMIDIEKYNLFKKMTKVRRQIKELEEALK